MRRTLRVLGPIEASIDDRAVDLGGPKQRLVLAILAAAGGQPVSMDRLVDALWDEGATPSRAEASVQAYVSNLRRELDPGRTKGTPSELLPTTPGGYRLAIDTDELGLDADRFAALADEGHDLIENDDPTDALTALAEGLALWRGAAYGDHATNPLVLSEARRLDELRWRATEDRWTAELALGRHERAIPELSALTHDAPLRERSWILLATALARSGRQVEALRAVRSGIDAIREETGLDPGPELRSLEQDLLDADATTAPTDTRTVTRAAAAPTPPSTPPPLVARQAELDILLDALARTEQEGGRTVVISGDPGIGKTHLARALSQHAETLGWAVAWGRSPDASDVPGLWPLQEALRGLARARGITAADLAPEGTDIGPLLDTADADSSHVTSTFALATALTAVLRDAASDQPVLLVVDDAQWADPGTIRMLRHLVGELHDLRVLLVITHRDIDAAQLDALAPLRDDVARSRDGRMIELKGLDLESVQALLDELDATMSPEAAATLQERTSGNPFFIHEIARTGAGTEGAPASVRDVLRGQLAALPADSRRVVDVLAVAGANADTRLLVAVTRQGRAEVVEALDPPIASGLVVEDAGPGRYRLAHDLIREAAYDELSAATRARLHHAVGQAIEEQWGDDPTHLPAQAWHLWKGVSVADPDHVLGVVCRAAEEADATDRLDESTERWRWAEALLESTGSEDDRLRVVSSLGRAMIRAGDVLAARVPLKAAAQIAKARGDWATVADLLTATSELSMWTANAYPEVDDEMVRLLEEAREHLSDGDARRAAVSSRLAIELYYSDDEERTQPLIEEALTLARQAGDARLHAVVLSQAFAANQRPHRLHQLLELTDEMATLEPESEIATGELEAITATMRGYVRLVLGQVDESASEMAAADRHTSFGQLPYLSSQLRWYKLTRLLLAGHLEAAEVAYEDAAAFYTRVGGLGPYETTLISLLGLRLEQGKVEELLDPLRAFADGENAETTGWGEILLVVLLDAGLEDEARERALARPYRSPPRDFIWTTYNCCAAWARGRLGLVDDCRVILDALLPHSGQVAVTGQLPPALGPVDFFIGLLSAVCGDDEQAESHLRQAIELDEKLGARAWLARALHELAGVLDRRDPANAESEALRERARHLAGQVGNPVLIRQVGD